MSNQRRQIGNPKAANTSHKTNPNNEKNSPKTNNPIHQEQSYPKQRHKQQKQQRSQHNQNGENESLNSLNITSDISTSESILASSETNKAPVVELNSSRSKPKQNKSKNNESTNTDTINKNIIYTTTKNQDHDHFNKNPPPVRYFTRKASLFDTDENSSNKYQKTVMKSKNNQSSFANNPTHSYSDQYYTSIGQGKGAAGGPRLPYGVYDPYMYPYAAAPPLYAPPAPVPYVYPPAAAAAAAAAAYHSPPGILPYNYYMRPVDPSVHDLLYLDTFRTKEASYANKHIEKKVRAIDGYWNPHVRYTLKDYKNFKATMGFGEGIGKPGEFDPESKNEKMEKMMKMKEAGNYFMKANRPPKKANGNQMARSDPELPTIQNRSVANQGFYSLTPPGNTNYNNNQYAVNNNGNSSNQYYNNNNQQMNYTANNNNSNYNNGFGHNNNSKSNSNNSIQSLSNGGHYINNNNQTNQLASDLFLHDLNSNRSNANHTNNSTSIYTNSNMKNGDLSNDIFNDYNYNSNNNSNNNYNGYGQQQQNSSQAGNKLYKNPKYNFDSKGNIVSKDTKNRLR